LSENVWRSRSRRKKMNLTPYSASNSPWPLPS
jgi:hypothetical protein